MKILLTTDTYLPTVGGIPNAVRDLMSYFEEKNISYGLVAPGPAIKNEKHVYRLTHFSDPFIKGKTGAIFPIAFFQAASIIKKENPTVIHIEEGGGIGISSLFWGKIYRKKIIGTLHTDPEQVVKINIIFRLIPFFKFFVKKYLEFFYNQCDVITTPGKSYSKNMSFKKRVFVIPNGISLTKYFPVGVKDLSFLKKYNIPCGKKILLYVGRLDPDKNIDFLIRAFSKIKDDNLILLIVGVGALVSYLHDLAKKTPRMVVISNHDHSEIPQFYQAADVFVTASKIEVQSLTALEAMASGLPIVAAAAAGMVDLCLNNVNGLLFEPDDASDFINKIHILWKNEVKFSQMKKESRKIAEEYELSHCLQKYVDLYGSI